MNESFAMLSIVVPVYRSAEVLPELTSRLIESCRSLGQSFEIILVEDCGGDDSWAVIRRLADDEAHSRFSNEP